MTIEQLIQLFEAMANLLIIVTILVFAILADLCYIKYKLTENKWIKRLWIVQGCIAAGGAVILTLTRWW